LEWSTCTFFRSSKEMRIHGNKGPIGTFSNAKENPRLKDILFFKENGFIS